MFPLDYPFPSPSFLLSTPALPLFFLFFLFFIVGDVCSFCLGQGKPPSHQLQGQHAQGGMALHVLKFFLLLLGTRGCSGREGASNVESEESAVDGGWAGTFGLVWYFVSRAFRLPSPCRVRCTLTALTSFSVHLSVCVFYLSHVSFLCVVQVVDARMYRVVASLSHRGFRTSSSFSRACLSPSAAYAAAASANGDVYVWDIAASSSSGAGSSSSSSSSSAAAATVLQTHGVAATGCDWCLNMPSTLASCDSKGGLRVWG